MGYLAQVEQARAQSAVLDLLARASDLNPGDPLSAQRFALSCTRNSDVRRAPAAWRRLVAARPDDAGALAGLAAALLDVGDVGGALAAGALAVDLAPANGALHSAYAFALRASGDDDRADAIFERGHGLSPDSPYLIRGLGQALIRRGDGRGLAAHLEAAMDRIAPTGWLVAQYATALAMLGRRKALSSLIDYDRLVRTIAIPVPDGFASLDEFNATLRREQRALGSAPSGVAALDVVHGAIRISGGLQAAIIALGEAGAPASTALLRLFEIEQEAYVAALAASGERQHLATRPADTWLRTETLITPRQGYVAPHMHACTWLSGVYYAAVPEGMKGGEGCLEFLPPRHKIAIADGLWPSFLLKPRPGQLTLFPGYLYHHVYPTDAPGDRAVVTFDVKPVRESRVPGFGVSEWLACLGQE